MSHLFFFFPGTIVERRTLTKVEASLLLFFWHLHRWQTWQTLSGSLQAWPLGELAKIYRPLEWSDIGSRALLEIQEFAWCHSEFQVVVNKLSAIPWGTAFMDLTFDLNSAFASLRTRGSWDLMVLLPKESQISDIFSPVARSTSKQDFLGKSNSKDLKRSLLLSSGGEGPKRGI